MKISICGDFTTKGNGAKAVAKGSALSSSVLKLLQESNLNVVNLESPVVTDKSCATQKSGPSLNTDFIAVEYLKKCGFNLVTLANNHFYDYGRHGVENTIDALNKNEIGYVGGGLTAEEYRKVYYYNHDGIRVAILNYCESEFSVTDNEGSNPMNPIHVFNDLREAKKHSDYRIVITHGGHEGYNLPSPRMKELYRFFIDAGADVVCNHHQHCYSGYEKYNGGHIFYGLGNFFFYDTHPNRQKNDIWNYGYIVSLEINLNGLTCHPIAYSQCLNSLTINLLEAEDEEAFWKNYNNLSSIIQDEKLLEESFRVWCNQQRDLMLSWLSPYSNRYLLALCRRGLLPKFLGKKKRIQLFNCIRCESHRDILIKSLE